MDGPSLCREAWTATVLWVTGASQLFPSPERQWQCVLVGKHGLQGLGLGPPCASDSLSCYRGSLLICTVRIRPVPRALPGAVHL